MRTKFCLLLTTLLMYFALSAQTQYVLLTGQSDAVAVDGTTGIDFPGFKIDVKP